MPRAPVPDAPVLSTRALNRATLARQSLIERSPMAPKAMVEHLVGMQAPLPPYFGLWSRLESFQRSHGRPHRGDARHGSPRDRR